MSAQLSARAELAAALRQALADPGSVPDVRLAELGRRLVAEMIDRTPVVERADAALARILGPPAVPDDLHRLLTHTHAR